MLRQPSCGTRPMRHALPVAVIVLGVATLAVTATPGVGAADDPVVSVAQGEARGRITPHGAVFKGLPFAASTAGLDGRWRAPRHAPSWSGVRDAGEFGPTCAQIDAGWNRVAAERGSEDCLLANVWTAEWPVRTSRPVMVWIHGGGNAGGSALGAGGIEPPFDGERLAGHGVVVVTIQYRLGLLGFLAHPELTSESATHTSGNYGLLDQIAALEWVRDNVASFGGDPAHVTIFGQSAGAHDIGLLMTSPLAKGLFQKAIAESGTVLIRGQLTPSLAEKERAGIGIARALGAPASGAIQHLRGLTVAQILEAAPPYGEPGPTRPEPVVDGHVLPDLPARAFQQGREAQVPLLIGSNARERTVPVDTLGSALDDFYGPLAGRARDAYGIAVGSQGSTFAPHGDAGAQFATDQAFRCGTVMIAAWHSRSQPTYHYEFTVGPEPRGARHSQELRYVFGIFPDPATAADRRVSDVMQAYWTNFAKTGNPNGQGLSEWPTYDVARRAYLEIGTEQTMKTDLRGEPCRLFAERVAPR